MIIASDNEADSGIETVPREYRLSRGWQWVLLILIGFHMLAVFSEPFHFFSRSPVQSAADADALRNITTAYAQWMFLDHGYFFFAPNPGPGRLLQAKTSDTPLVAAQPNEPLDPYDGLLYPNRNQHHPRLLYHRYFMFSEFYYSRFAPVEISPELNEDQAFRARWKEDRRIYKALQESVTEHIKWKTNQPYVRLDRLERRLPDRDSILKRNIRLSDLQWLTRQSESMLEESPPPNIPIPSPYPAEELVPSRQ